MKISKRNMMLSALFGLTALSCGKTTPNNGGKSANGLDEVDKDKSDTSAKSAKDKSDTSAKDTSDKSAKDKSDTSAKDTSDKSAKDKSDTSAKDTSAKDTSAKDTSAKDTSDKSAKDTSDTSAKSAKDTSDTSAKSAKDKSDTSAKDAAEKEKKKLEEEKLAAAKDAAEKEKKKLEEENVKQTKVIEELQANLEKAKKDGEEAKERHKMQNACMTTYGELLKSSQELETSLVDMNKQVTQHLLIINNSFEINSNLKRLNKEEAEELAIINFYQRYLGVTENPNLKNLRLLVEKVREAKTRINEIKYKKKWHELLTKTYEEQKPEILDAREAFKNSYESFLNFFQEKEVISSDRRQNIVKVIEDYNLDSATNFEEFKKSKILTNTFPLRILIDGTDQTFVAYIQEHQPAIEDLEGLISSAEFSVQQARSAVNENIGKAKILKENDLIEKNQVLHDKFLQLEKKVEGIKKILNPGE